jgi:tRNA-2-methylthio-N6-dimethylallyladenosine synthase
MVKTDTGRNYKIFMNHINPHHLKHLYHDLEDIFESGRIGVLGSQIQSGSNRILKLMGRRYTAEDWKEYMQRIHIRFPNIFLSTHFMVGYPTETDEDFKMTLKLIDQVFLDDAFIFKFSQRQNVPASRLPEQVSPKIVRKRYNTLRIKAGLNILRRKTQRLFSQ